MRDFTLNLCGKILKSLNYFQQTAIKRPQQKREKKTAKPQKPILDAKWRAADSGWMGGGGAGGRLQENLDLNDRKRRLRWFERLDKVIRIRFCKREIRSGGCRDLIRNHNKKKKKSRVTKTVSTSKISTANIRTKRSKGEKQKISRLYLWG